jgi:hypothetical protein
VEPDYARESQKPETRVVVEWGNPKGLSFRSAALSREESAVLLLAVSRFLADKDGFGMTKGARVNGVMKISTAILAAGDVGENHFFVPARTPERPGFSHPRPGKAAERMTEDARSGRVAEIMFWVLALAYVSFLLSLGAFPSEHGPVHLYYADVLKDLMAGGNSYGHYLAVRHWLPPYALIYYLFLALTRFVSPLAAERLFVCLYAILLACGFPYLLRVLNPRSTAMAVLVFPFIFNQFVYLGF